jgi:hypothetical protein
MRPNKLPKWKMGDRDKSNTSYPQLGLGGEGAETSSHDPPLLRDN